MSQNTPNPVDFCNVSSLLSNDERALQQRMATFVNEKIIPIAASSFDDGVFPREIITDLAKEGVFDCTGLNNVAYGLICQELERGDTGIRTFVSVQNSLVTQPIAEFGSDAQ
ncbi:MAG: acyl-CoA dehydrogenase, partial [Phycisphaerae bacterium]|nr:acyl-CoA dehydrogenase [Phycisphaerae bacterium]